MDGNITDINSKRKGDHQQENGGRSYPQKKPFGVWDFAKLATAVGGLIYGLYYLSNEVSDTPAEDTSDDEEDLEVDEQPEF